jgi:Ni,Fe-hydrogenase III small subunit
MKRKKNNVQNVAMSSKVDLKLDWCSHKAAKFACENWHYSKCMPSGKTVKIGVYENNIFIGCVIFALGANASISNLYGYKTAELARVALTKHTTPATKIISIAIKMLSKINPNLQLLVSYADTDRHEGIIYKAGNWVFIEKVVAKWISINGKPTHPRSIVAKYGTSSINWLQKNVDKNAHRVDTKGKNKYIYLLKKDLFIPCKNGIIKSMRQ